MAEVVGLLEDHRVAVQHRHHRDQQVTLLREDWELVTALTAPRSIAELAGELGRGVYSTARVVHRLQQAGLIELVSNDLDATIVPIRRNEPEVVEEPLADEGRADARREARAGGEGAEGEPVDPVAGVEPRAAAAEGVLKGERLLVAEGGAHGLCGRGVGSGDIETCLSPTEPTNGGRKAW